LENLWQFATIDNRILLTLDVTYCIQYNTKCGTQTAITKFINVHAVSYVGHTK